MKVLFLDIDGVLNRPNTRERCCGFTGVDRELSGKLVPWLKKNNVKVVLSSTWRLHPDMHDHLREAGIEWIDVTPSYESTLPRGSEIADYLSVHPEIERYAIIDDMEEMLEEQKEMFVQTNPLFGVTESDLRKLESIFNAS